jgi:ribosomal protein S18 acetylase RimI-like enzyme
MTAFVIRTAEPGEWQRYREIRLAALTRDPQAFGSTTERERTQLTAEQWQARLAARNTLFAESETLGVCGLAGVIREDDGRAHLVSVWVAPEARGRGVGELLVRAAVDRAAELGADRAWLWVAEDNTAAQRLYRRLNFRPTGRVQPIREGEPRRELEMARALVAAAPDT